MVKVRVALGCFLFFLPITKCTLAILVGRDDEKKKLDVLCQYKILFFFFSKKKMCKFQSTNDDALPLSVLTVTFCGIKSKMKKKTQMNKQGDAGLQYILYEMLNVCVCLFYPIETWRDQGEN